MKTLDISVVLNNLNIQLTPVFQDNLFIFFTKINIEEQLRNMPYQTTPVTG